MVLKVVLGGLLIAQGSIMIALSVASLRRVPDESWGYFSGELMARGVVALVGLILIVAGWSLLLG